jgi:hypothetical protein
VDRNGLILGVSAVLFGITALMLIVGIVVSPFFLAVAVPFGASAYLLWYQASGKLGDRVSREAAAGNLGDDRGFGFDPGPFGGRTADGDTARERARRARQNRRRGRRRTGASRETDPSTPSPSEARRILDVDATASDDEVKSAYRRKAKEHHPDTDSGDEEKFKQVSRAYERLSE